jgi:putative hydrolase of the HAD superfamily
MIYGNYFLESARKKKYKNIVFDNGGVLTLRDKTYAKNLYNEQLKPNGITEKEFENAVKDYFDFMYKRNGCFVNKKDVPILYKKELPKKLQKYYKEILECIARGARLADYSEPILKYLKGKGYKIYLLSNTNKWTWENYRNTTFKKIEKYFDGILLSHEEGIQKPDKAFYNLLFERYKLDPKECLFFDDKETNVKASKEVGMDAIVFDPKNTPSYIMNL